MIMKRRLQGMFRFWWGLLSEHWVLALGSAAGLGLLFLRFKWWGRSPFYFLAWNLFLAWVPMVFAQLAAVNWDQRRPVLAMLAGLIWLGFFPNAPYIVTDLFHLRARPPVPLWLDLWIFMHFAWLGLMIGFASLRSLHHAVTTRHGIGLGWIFAVLSLAAASVGIYLGRFQRWNTWSVLTHPQELMSGVMRGMETSTTDPRVIGFTAACFVFLLLAYLSISSWNRPPRESPRGADPR